MEYTLHEEKWERNEKVSEKVPSISQQLHKKTWVIESYKSNWV